VCKTIVYVDFFVLLPVCIINKWFLTLFYFLELGECKKMIDENIRKPLNDKLGKELSGLCVCVCMCVCVF
jgi:hypothetical protein